MGDTATLLDWFALHSSQRQVAIRVARLNISPLLTSLMTRAHASYELLQMHLATLWKIAMLKQPVATMNLRSIQTTIPHAS